MAQNYEQYGDYMVLVMDVSDDATKIAENLVKERVKEVFNTVIDDYLQTIVHIYEKGGKVIGKTVGVKMGVLKPDNRVERTIVIDQDDPTLPISIRMIAFGAIYDETQD